MLHVFGIHNEVLQNACSLHILLDSPTTCINNSAIAKRFQGKALPGLVVRMRSANTTLFSLVFPPSRRLLLALLVVLCPCKAQEE